MATVELSERWTGNRTWRPGGRSASGPGPGR